MLTDNQNVPAPPELPCQKVTSALKALEGLGYAYYGDGNWKPRPEEVDDCGRTKADRERDCDAIVAAGREWARVTFGKGNPSGYVYNGTVSASVMNGLDLEYSAIGDKSEPNRPASHDKITQDFEFRLGRLESRLNNEITARQLDARNIRAMILANSR